MDESITIRLRVTDSFKNKKIQVMINDQVLFSKKKNVLAPGEMEEIRLSKEQLLPYRDESQMIIRLEDCINGK